MRVLQFLSVMVAAVVLSSSVDASAQHALYPNRFDLQEVTLLDSPFKTAQEINYSTLLDYEADRMLTPYVRQAGLSNTTDEHNKYYQWEYEHPAFESFAWNPQMAMDGHILGHYLSALSISYASCHDAVRRSQFKQRIDYIVSVLGDCQKAFDGNKEMKGFIGGIPDNSIWTAMIDADYRPYNSRGNWVPFYCEHKVLAGLRDAAIYGENQQAKEMFRKMCDWVINVVAMFTDDIMEMQILQWEHGGINEVLADASQMFGDSKYMKGAQKFTHKIVLENMNADIDHDFLDKKQATEMTANFLGVARMDELKHDNKYAKAAALYWEDAAMRRSSAIGGIGVSSYFQPKAKASVFVTDADGPEMCSTYNMLKLSEQLFASSRSARYSDYYESALLNHVLGSIDPKTGGYTYYTSLRPESYRIYSKMNEAMWCCVGTGMESHSKYGDFIYTMSQDTLFVNLFIASELNNSRVVLTQETAFPYGSQSKITIRKAGNYQIAVRHPRWATNGYSVKVNGKDVKCKPELVNPGTSSYIACGKGWKAGDVIEVNYPMTLTFAACPGNNDYIALRWGPTVLAAQTTPSEGEAGYEALPREYGGEGLHDHSPQSRLKFPDMAFAPMLICERSQVPTKIRPVDLNKMIFDVDATAPGSKWKQVRMIPFFSIHHARYAVYWNQQTETAWLRNPLFKDQLRKAEMASLTYDAVTPGDNASESAHKAHLSKTGSRGNLNGMSFRDAQPGEWFEYTLDLTNASADQAAGSQAALVCKFSLTDKGRSCAIVVNGVPVKTYEVPSSKPNVGKDKFFDEIFIIPSEQFRNRKSLTVRFESENGSFVPRLYQASIMKYDPKLMR